MEQAQQSNSSPIFSAALAWANAGFSVVPSRLDGSKAPIGSWKKYQSERANAMQIHEWFKSPEQTGFGIILGRVSGNAEMLEFEGRAVVKGLVSQAQEIMTNSGLDELWQRLLTSYIEATPSGGLHLYYRVSGGEIGGNTKLARQPGEDGGVLIETRSEGGFSIVAPSSGSVHPSGASWTALRGSPSDIPTITIEERDAIHDVLRMLDQMPAAESVLNAVIKVANEEDNAGGGVSPGDDFNKRADWSELLVGWTKVFTDRAGVSYWRRPGKSVGVSATTGKNDADNLYVFSTSTEFEAEKPYSKFAAFTFLKYGGDYKAAARNLRLNGYGVPAIALGVDHIQQAEPATSPEEGEASSATAIAPDRFLSTEEAMLREEIMRGRVRRTAKGVLDSEDALKKYDGFVYIETLSEELERPIEEVAWTIEGVMPKGANITLTAQYKAGKTTLINHLAKTLADNSNFLTFFNKPNHDGRIVIFNYEVSENQYRRWMNDVAIENSDKVTLVHLRGKSVPLKSEHVRDQVVKVLSTLACETWIVDPFARAFTGSGDENSNSDVGVFLDQLDIIKERAGVSNLILPVHTGRGIEFGGDLRARGATRMDDWADVRWMLKKTDDGRFFSADGRDVSLEEQQLKYDEKNRSLVLGGSDARTTRKSNREDEWVMAVRENPGRSTVQILEMLRKTKDDKTLLAARKSAKATGKCYTVSLGSAEMWYPEGFVLPKQEELA